MQMRGMHAQLAALHDARKKRRDPSNSQPVGSKRGPESKGGFCGAATS